LYRRAVGERVDSVVIGAGQAGLSTSYHLTQNGREHVVLERGQVGETWRSERWDGFFLNTPNWTLALPGGEYAGPEPDSFAPRDGIVSYVEGYARAIEAPVREGVGVSALGGDDRGYVLETGEGRLEAANVVVATGAFQRPLRPPVADALPADLVQLRAAEYRNPQQLPDGSVLVVGSGQSGCQIVEELLQAGRRVYLAVGRCPWFPRRLRGHDLVHWAIEVGLMDETVDTLPSPAARLACNPALSGNDGGHDCNPRTLARNGAILVGRLEGCKHRKLLFGDGLGETLAAGDEFEAAFRRRVDEHIEREGLDAPEDPPADPPVAPAEPPRELDLRASGITSVVWASGYRPDFSWIEPPLTDDLGWPRQRRGVSDRAGLFFVGLHWLHKRKSALLFGVGEDAEHVVSQLVRR
jgi:putative flavoprotein involved in K+ transport